MKRQVCERSKAGRGTWEPKCVSARSANRLIADAGPAEYLKNWSRRLGRRGGGRRRTKAWKGGEWLHGGKRDKLM